MIYISKYRCQDLKEDVREFKYRQYVVWNELKEYGYLKESGNDCPMNRLIETNFIVGDSFINNLKFNKIFIQGYNDSVNVGCFREEDRKVYYTGVDYFGFNTDSVVLLYDFNKQKNDTVFFLDPKFNEFQILYDFNANKSDSWIIKVMDDYEEGIDTITVTVDSVSITTINCNDLKTLYVSYRNAKYHEYIPYVPSKIIERIGDLEYMFNWWEFAIIVCDANWTRGLRCYSDHEIGLYSTNIADSCDYTYDWTGIGNQEQLNAEFTIFPNPASDFVIIKINKPSEFNYDILNQNGVKIQSGKSDKSDTEIDLSDYNPGLYIIRLYNSKDIIGVCKVIKLDTN